MPAPRNWQARSQQKHPCPHKVAKFGNRNYGADILMSGRKLDSESMNLPSVILASASPRRSELLRQLGVQFEVIPSSAPESESEHLSPGELCSLNAYRKARIISKHHPDAL